MNAIRNLILSTAVFCLLFTMGASDARAQVHRRGHGHVGNVHVQARYYYIYYRGCAHQSWTYYGASANYQQVVAYANWIQSLGYEVYVY